MFTAVVSCETDVVKSQLSLLVERLQRSGGDSTGDCHCLSLTVTIAIVNKPNAHAPVHASADSKRQIFSCTIGTRAVTKRP